MKFLRTIRFDQSDEHVFAVAAVDNEWALPGGFEFAGITADRLTGKTRQAFANGFLGVPSFGRSTFAATAEISDAEHDRVVDMLARHFVDRLGAPSADAARAAALGETRFVIDLCAENPINTVFTLRRVLDDGEIREEFRIITAPSKPLHARVWDVIEDDA